MKIIFYILIFIAGFFFYPLLNFLLEKFYFKKKDEALIVTSKTEITDFLRTLYNYRKLKTLICIAKRRQARISSFSRSLYSSSISSIVSPLDRSLRMYWTESLVPLIIGLPARISGLFTILFNSLFSCIFGSFYWTAL